MAKITFIGAGSFGFTRGLVRDILTYPLLRGAEIALMDVDPQRLEYSERAVRRIIRDGGYPARVEATTDRAAALRGADAVLCTILAGGVDVWRHDIEIPARHGVDINVGDTRGPAGIFRALRTIPVMLDICRDMERCCPEAILLNYTNPMAMLCRAMQQRSRIRVTGLCHSVQGTARMLTRWIGAAPEEVTWLCAGINHQAWYLEFRKNGRDAYPLLRRTVRENRDIYRAEPVRNEMFLHLGRYVTESSGHNSEYNWWFRKRPDLVRRYCLKGTNWNPGEHAYIVRTYLERERTWRDDIERWLGEPFSLERGAEYAAGIINAFLGGEPFLFNGNVANTGLIPNLPPAACVEVPVLADRRGFSPLHVGPLPPQCAALNNINVASEEMAVAGALAGDAGQVFHAVACDPLTAAVLSLAEIRRLVREMFAFNRPWLKNFRSVRF